MKEKLKQEERETLGVDQRSGRSYAEIDSERKGLWEATHSMRICNAYWLSLGAWLALSWVVDDDEQPASLRERLEKAG